MDRSQPLLAAYSLEYYREQRGLDIAAFASLLGVSEARYLSIIEGESEVEVATQQQIANRLGVFFQLRIGEFLPKLPLDPELHARLLRPDRSAPAFVLDPITGTFSPYQGEA